MAYQLDRYNGTFLVNVDDGSIETNSTDLRFVGKNYAGYGELQNENFLHLLENFANNTPPPKAISGQIWYDSGARKLKYYDNNRWKVASGAEVGIIAPSGLEPGEFWFDSSSRQLYTWTGQDFVLIGPETGPELGAAGVTSQVVKELGTGNNFTILRLLAGGKTIGVISQDEFILDESQTPIEDFFLPEGLRRIKKGFNLTKTGPNNGVTSNDYVFWGTASDAQRLGGVAANQYLQKGSLVFDNEVSFKDPGFQLGDQNDLRVRVENNDQVVFENRLGNNLIFRITVSPTDRRDIAIITANGIEPRDSSYNLGRIGARWNEIHATSVFGNVTGNITGNSVGSHKGNVLANDDSVLINAATKTIGFPGVRFEGTLFGNITGSADAAENANRLTGISPSIELPIPANKTSIPVRNASGNITAAQFIGTADKSDELLVTDLNLGTYVQAKITPDANTVAARDSGGNINAVLFQGTATAARYADLAEKYLPDTDYECGTVVVVGGSAEVTKSKLGDRAIGVISINPAFMMNKDLDNGVYVALKGRVPAKISGPIIKGDRLVAAENGTAKKAEIHEYSNVFAIALESNVDAELKIIEILVI